MKKKKPIEMSVCFFKPRPIWIACWGSWQVNYVSVIVCLRYETAYTQLLTCKCGLSLSITASLLLSSIPPTFSLSDGSDNSSNDFPVRLEHNESQSGSGHKIDF